MKITLPYIFLTLLIVSTLFLPNSFAQDFTQSGLPEDAIARLGKGWISDTAYSPDSTRLAVATSIGIWVYDAQTFQESAQLFGHTGVVRSVAFSPDGNTIASSSDDDTVRLWDATTGQHMKTLTEHTGAVWSVCFSPDGKVIASSSDDDTVRLWDITTGTLLETFTKHTNDVYNVVFSPDGNTIASNGDWDNTVRLWDVTTGTLLETLIEHAEFASQVSFSPDGEKIVTGSNDDTVRLWDATTGNLLETFMGHTGWITSVNFDPDGNTIVSGSLDGTVRLWDATTGNLLETFMGHTGTIDSVAFSPDGNTIASGGDWSDRMVRLWDATTGNLLETFMGHTGTINSVAFSPDGNTIASASNDNTVRLWDITTGTLLETFTGHTGYVNSVAFSPDGNTIASSDRTGIRLWDITTGTLLETFTGHTGYVNSVAFSPDGNTIASASNDNTVRLWDATIGEETKTLTGHTDAVQSVAFSPDGNTIASSSRDQTIKLWDATTGEEIKTLTGHTDAVQSVTFSPDGNTIASSSTDGTVLLWELISPVPSDTSVRISASIVEAPTIGEELMFPLKIADGKNVVGYQATVSYDPSVFNYVRSENGDYLPAGSYFSPPVVAGNTVTLAATSFGDESNGAGTLATLTFELVAIKSSTLKLSGVSLVDSDGMRSFPRIEDTDVEITESYRLIEDINEDGIVNIQDLVLVASNLGETGKNRADVNADGVVDIVDLVLVAGVIEGDREAPAAWSRELGILPTRAELQQWLHKARQVSLTNAAFQRGISMLEQLLMTLTPKETSLLSNYPNPFNPETWIPYQLATPVDVTVTIYDINGSTVRTLILGHQFAGVYHSQERAAYWDGRNAQGEPVASGVYFYTLTAGKFAATRKMLITK